MRNMEFEMESVNNVTDQKTENQCQKLIRLMIEYNYFHSEDGTAFIEIKTDNGCQNWPIRSDKVFGLIQELYYNENKTLPEEKNIKKVLSILCFKAQKLNRQKVYYRTAFFNKKIYIDLANTINTFIEIDETGWREVNEAPVKFYKSNSIKPLSTPKTGQSIHELRKFINISDEHDYILFLSFIVGALYPSKQYPLLILQGPQGSGKTTASDILKEIIDPSIPTLRSFPKREEDIFIAAKFSHLVCFDNLSGINAMMSDTLCKISTGCGIAARKLYTNDEEYFIEVTRPIVINGIDDLTARPDLADRSIVLNLEKLTSGGRVSSSQLADDFQNIKHFILGNICDALSMALQKKNEILLSEKPRMVDFCMIACSGLQAFGYTVDNVISAFMKNKLEVASETIEFNSVGRAVKKFMLSRNFWQGSASELLLELQPIVQFSDTAWGYRNPSQISRELNRVSQALLSEGIDVGSLRTPTKRYIVLKKIEKMASQMSLLSGSNQNKSVTDACDGVDGKNIANLSGGFQ